MRVAEEVASQPSLKGTPVRVALPSCQERGAAPKRPARPLGTAPSLGPTTAVGMPPAGCATPEVHTGAGGAYGSGSFGMAHTAEDADVGRAIPVRSPGSQRSSCRQSPQALAGVLQDLASVARLGLQLLLAARWLARELPRGLSHTPRARGRIVLVGQRCHLLSAQLSVQHHATMPQCSTSRPVAGADTYSAARGSWLQPQLHYSDCN